MVSVRSPCHVGPGCPCCAPFGVSVPCPWCPIHTLLVCLHSVMRAPDDRFQSIVMVIPRFGRDSDASSEMIRRMSPVRCPSVLVQDPLILWVTSATSVQRRGQASPKRTSLAGVLHSVGEPARAAPRTRACATLAQPSKRPSPPNVSPAPRCPTHEATKLRTVSPNTVASRAGPTAAVSGVAPPPSALPAPPPALK